MAAGVAVLYLLVTLVGWLICPRRPDLDAAGVEIIGELRVRIANLHRDDTDWPVQAATPTATATAALPSGGA